MTHFLDELRLTRALPKIIALDNGPKMTSKAMFVWTRQHAVKLHFDLAKPTQNAFVESFNGRFRELCLNLHHFTS